MHNMIPRRYSLLTAIIVVLLSVQALLGLLFSIFRLADLLAPGRPVIVSGAAIFTGPAAGVALMVALASPLIAWGLWVPVHDDRKLFEKLILEGVCATPVCSTSKLLSSRINTGLMTPTVFRRTIEPATTWSESSSQGITAQWCFRVMTTFATDTILDPVRKRSRTLVVRTRQRRREESHGSHNSS